MEGSLSGIGWQDMYDEYKSAIENGLRAAGVVFNDPEFNRWYIDPSSIPAEVLDVSGRR